MSGFSKGSESPICQEERMLAMYVDLYGDPRDKSGKFDLVPALSEHGGEPLGIWLTKHGDNCAYIPKSELLFEWVTKDIKAIEE